MQEKLDNEDVKSSPCAQEEMIDQMKQIASQAKEGMRR